MKLNISLSDTNFILLFLPLVTSSELNRPSLGQYLQAFKNVVELWSIETETYLLTYLLHGAESFLSS